MKRVLILLADGFEALEAAGFTDVLGWADTSGSERIQIVTAGARPSLRCTFGLTVVPDLPTAEVDVEDFDALAIPGGFEEAGFYEDAFSVGFGQVIRRFDEQKKPIASICVGALPVAKSGVLRGRNATTYDLLDGKRRDQLADMGALVVDHRIVRDGNIITSTSPATAIDVAFALLEELTSAANAAYVRKLMGFA